MKRSKKLYTLLGVLVLICVITFGVSKYEEKKELIKKVMMLIALVKQISLSFLDG